MSGSRRVTTLVVGGGPAGATVALCLARRGLRAAVVESSDYKGFRVGETLPSVARVLLHRLGLWEEFAAQGHVPSQAVHSAWGSAELAEQHSLFSPFGTGWHVDRSRFDAMLSACAEEHGATVFRAARVASLSGDGPFRARVEGPGIRLDVEAEIVVDATGRASRVARSLGSERVAYDRLIGILGVFGSLPGHAPPAPALVLEAAPEGWLYSVPLPGGSLLAVAMVDADTIPRGGLRPIECWQRMIERSSHTRSRVTGLCAPGSVVVRKASTDRLSRIAGLAFLAVGDAATSYDPLSSQGICKALMSGELAAQAIAARLAGDDAAFEEYERRVAAELEGFLVDRSRFYAMERRWQGELFWLRRRPVDARDRALWLDPRAVLRRGEEGLSGELLARLEGALPLGEIERLHAQCCSPALAHEILSIFQRTSATRSPDRDVLSVLQGLVRGGVVVLDPSSEGTHARVWPLHRERVEVTPA